jgi:hypothetical protein
MGPALKVHPSFFREFASKTWTSPYGVVAELVENSFDEDATRVLVTLLPDGSVIVEDDVGMDESGFDTFLIVGSPHKAEENVSLRFNRPRSGRYGTGRLGFLTAFERMVVKTSRSGHTRGVSIDGGVFERLISGEADLDELNEPPLQRDGTEIRLIEPRLHTDPLRLRRELTRLAILRYPFFEIHLKEAADHRSWSFDGAEQLKTPQADGLRIEVVLPSVSGEIIVTKRPVSEDERGLAIIVGSHMVDRRDLGFNVERITGWIRFDGLTTRFADKASLIEDQAYLGFQRSVRAFIRDEVIPKAQGFAEAVITSEEARVYRKVDSLLAGAVHAVLEPVDTVWEDEAGQNVVSYQEEIPSAAASERLEEVFGVSQPIKPIGDEDKTGIKGFATPLEHLSRETKLGSLTTPTDQEIYVAPPSSSAVQPDSNVNISPKPQTPRKHNSPAVPRVRRTFTLRKVGFRVIPYEDEEDEREGFAEQNLIYVNKAHSTYRAEAQRGSGLLLRHVVRLVSKMIALEKFPEGREALDLQNRLIAEAIRLTRTGRNRLPAEYPQ